MLGDQYTYPLMHLGTAGNGAVVAVYPRCTRIGDGYLSGCRLFRYALDSGVEQRLQSVHRPQRFEYEGDMDHGALLYAALDYAHPDRPSASGLWYQPTHGRARRLARNGGWGLALDGRWVAHLISDGSIDESIEPCENATVVLRTLSDRGKVLGRECRPDVPFGTWQSLSLSGSKLTWVRHGLGLYRFDGTTGVLERGRPTDDLGEFQPTSPDAGIALLAPNADDYATQVRLLDKLTWKVSHQLPIKKVPRLLPDPLA